MHEYAPSISSSYYSAFLRLLTRLFLLSNQSKKILPTSPWSAIVLPHATKIQTYFENGQSTRMQARTCTHIYGDKHARAHTQARRYIGTHMACARTHTEWELDSSYRQFKISFCRSLFLNQFLWKLTNQWQDQKNIQLLWQKPNDGARFWWSTCCELQIGETSRWTWIRVGFRRSWNGSWQRWSELVQVLHPWQSYQPIHVEICTKFRQKKTLGVRSPSVELNRGNELEKSPRNQFSKTSISTQELRFGFEKLKWTEVETLEIIRRIVRSQGEGALEVFESVELCNWNELGAKCCGIYRALFGNIWGGWTV